jgi:hypothetical protein
MCVLGGPILEIYQSVADLQISYESPKSIQQISNKKIIQLLLLGLDIHPTISNLYRQTLKTHSEAFEPPPPPYLMYD